MTSIAKEYTSLAFVGFRVFLPKIAGKKRSGAIQEKDPACVFTAVSSKNPESSSRCGACDI